MKGSYNLSFGFLFLYDWMPMVDSLSGEEFKALFKAIVARQRYGTPIPRLKGELTRMFANMIEPAIKRRLEGQKGGLKSQEKNKKQGLPEGFQKDLPEGLREDVPEGLTKDLSEGVPKGVSKGLPKAPPEARKEKRSEEKKSRAIYPSGAESLPKDYGAPAGARNTQQEENFATVDFFTAALMRSYGEDALSFLPTDKGNE